MIEYEYDYNTIIKIKFETLNYNIRAIAWLRPF